MSGGQIALFVVLFAATIPLAAIARRANIAYPIVLVAYGLVVGFLPWAPRVRFDPNLVLLLFVPPLLYWQSVTAPTDVMRRNAAQIWLMAVGLVVVTAASVAAVAHAVVGLSWPLAFVLGSVVAPTDEIASAPVLERFRMPRHLIAIVEGESLLNDATSLVMYSAAVGAVVYGTFSTGETALRFLIVALGSFPFGWLIGRLAIEGWRRIRDMQLQAAISFVVPFLSYEPAQALNLSGVLSVVMTGIRVNRETPIVMTAQSRMASTGYWDTIVFIANALLFLLLGLELHDITTATLSRHSWQSVLEYAVVVNVVVIAVRFAWVVGQEFVPRIGAAYEHQQPDVKHAIVAAWSGLRGAVSLAAALAIPAFAHGAPLRDRDLVIFLTVTVIAVTLIGGGLTLPLVVRKLQVQEADEERSELLLARQAMVDAALRRLAELEASGKVEHSFAESLRAHFQLKRDLLEHPDDESLRERLRRRTEVQNEIIDAQRRALIELRRQGKIDNAVLRQLQPMLDRGETQYENDPLLE